MDRDTLQDDLDLILERSRDDKLPASGTGSPPRDGRPGRELGRGARHTHETDTEASSEGATDLVDGPDDEEEDD